MLVEKARKAVERARSSANGLASQAQLSAQEVRQSHAVGKAWRDLHPHSPDRDPFQALTAGSARFTHEALAAAALVGDAWVTVVRDFVDDTRQKVDGLLEAMRNPPAPADDFRPQARWHQELDNRVETVRQLMNTYSRHTTPALEQVIEEAKQERLAIEKAEKAPKLPSTQPESVINVLLNVLHLYQFNVQVINVTLDQTIERETGASPEAEREEFRALALDLKTALASGNRDQVRAALEGLRAWVAANPGDRAIAVIGLLFAILSILLAL